MWRPGWSPWYWGAGRWTAEQEGVVMKRRRTKRRRREGRERGWPKEEGRCLGERDEEWIWALCDNRTQNAITTKRK